MQLKIGVLHNIRYTDYNIHLYRYILSFNYSLVFVRWLIIKDYLVHTLLSISNCPNEAWEASCIFFKSKVWASATFVAFPFQIFITSFFETNKIKINFVFLYVH